MADEVVYSTEQTLLGWLIQRPNLIGPAFERVPPEQFTGPHAIIAETLEGMNSLGADVTPMTLLMRLQRNGTLARVGGGATIHTLVASCGVNGEFTHLLDSLERNYLRRSARAIGQRLVQMTENLTIEPEEAAQHAREALENLGHVRTEIETIGWPDDTEQEEDPEWVIPMLMSVDERAFITGGEGLGKSMIIRQLVASVAVGMHPFGPYTFEPAPALHVDLENPRDVSNRAYRRIRNGLRSEDVYVPDLLHRLEPRQFDITNPQDVSWLMRAVRQVEPKMIAIGPLKNMTGGEDPNEERTAVRVQSALNRIRAETSAALVLEGHAGYSDRETWRPRGSSAWLGWPEVGLGLKPIEFRPVRKAQLVEWRGARTEHRFWPQYITEGTAWPWVEDPRIEEELNR